MIRPSSMAQEKVPFSHTPAHIRKKESKTFKKKLFFQKKIFFQFFDTFLEFFLISLSFLKFFSHQKTSFPFFSEICDEKQNIKKKRYFPNFLKHIFEFLVFWNIFLEYFFVYSKSFSKLCMFSNTF